MDLNSSDIAKAIDSKAKEIAAAMRVYPRLPETRDQLVEATGLYIRDLNDLWAMFQRKRQAENGQE
jgi:hypothetical protein